MAGTREQHYVGAIAANLASHRSQTRADLDRDGLVRLKGVISPGWVTAARTDVDRYLSRYGTGEHSLVDGDEWECPNIAELAVDEGIEAFLHSLTSLPEAAELGYAGYRQRVLRILDGSGLDSPPFDWHYDANAVTMLIPIVIPDDGSGLLAMFPDHRPHRRWAALSAAERLVVHSKMYGHRLRRRYDSDPSAFTVPLTPGDAYLFRGYRALHATLPWAPGTLRVTLLLQYGHPYGPDGVTVQAVRARRDALRKRRSGQLHVH
ncbi:hypothetical protein BH09ACT7_BH09ACT7_40060 [soil metagenome]